MITVSSHSYETLFEKQQLLLLPKKPHFIASKFQISISSCCSYQGQGKFQILGERIFENENSVNINDLSVKFF